MGSEYPKQGDRRISVKQFPGLVKNQLRKSSSSTTAGGAASSKVPKTALTPISRLKKFQKLRDRNLRKEVLYRNNIKKQLKMLETATEPQPSGSPPTKSPQMLKELVKLENGNKETENGEKENCEKENGESVLNGIEEEVEVEHNGVVDHEEVRRSPRRSRTKEEVVQHVVEEKEEEEKEALDTNLNGDDPSEESPVKHIPEHIEVDVEIIENPPLIKTKRRSTPRRASPEVSSTLPETTGDIGSQDFNWLNHSMRISGRRPIRDMSPPRKRKSEEYSDEPASKRIAYTPSVPSPGWRFLSPFSLFKRTPRSVNRPVNDSLFVNLSTDSETNLDDSSEASVSPQVEESSTPGTSGDDIERPTTESPSKSMNWLCRIM